MPITKTNLHVSVCFGKTDTRKHKKASSFVQRVIHQATRSHHDVALTRHLLTIGYLPRLLSPKEDEAFLLTTMQIGQGKRQPLNA